MIRNIADVFNNLVLEQMKENADGKNIPISKKIKRVAASAMIQFTVDEIEQMGDAFKAIFCADGDVAHISKYQVDNPNPTYEIRYCRHGINISVTDKDLKTAKALFIKETQKLKI